MRAVFALARTRPTAALKALHRWVSWARRCRIDAFVDLPRRIPRHYDAIRDTLTTGMSNELIESTDTKTRLVIRRGFGFHTAEAIIALVMLTLAGGFRRLRIRRERRDDIHEAFLGVAVRLIVHRHVRRLG
ncbi:transposase [Streptomyces coelicoflavus]|uniref:transposase n=1 Tax=Streptomyces coelicoflavus TaxID=285562 RepID=UPI0036398468